MDSDSENVTPSSTDEEAGPLGTTLRVGTVRSCRPNQHARRPAWVLEIDLGPHGVRTTSAQLTDRYPAEDLIGRQVVVATNLGVKRIAGIKSEVLVLGVAGPEQATILLQPAEVVPDGGLVH